MAARCGLWIHPSLRCAASRAKARPGLHTARPPTALDTARSLGVLLVELTTGQPVQRRTSWRLPRAPAECSPAVLALIEQCLSNDSAHRPSAAEALQRLRADGAAADGAA